MLPAALVLTPVMAWLLARPLFAALQRSADATATQTRRARDAEQDASRAERARDKSESTAAKLTRAAELAEKQERERQPHDAPPAPPEPEPERGKLYDAPLAAEPTKPKSETLTALGKEQPSKKQWAESLYAYAAREIHEGRSANLGDATHPNAKVRAAQDGMGKLKSDGIYGSKTRARGKELTGKDFPARRSMPLLVKPPPASKPAHREPERLPPPPPVVRVDAPPASTSRTEERMPAPAEHRSPKQAASELYDYVMDAQERGKMATLLGTRAKPSEVVQLAQADMGGLTADGIYGPSTRARGRALLDKPFPARA